MMLFNFLTILTILFFVAKTTGAIVKQLGSICDPLAQHSECGRHAKCFPVQKQCGAAKTGICLCAAGYRQIIPRELPQGLLGSAKVPLTKNYTQVMAEKMTPWTDCHPLAKLGQSCRVDDNVQLALPDGAVCDPRTGEVKCSLGSIQFEGKCVDSIGQRTFGQKCGERIASLTACDPAKKLACLPAGDHRRCQCSPGFYWREIFVGNNNITGHCVQRSLGENCQADFECNVAQYKANHLVSRFGIQVKSPHSIAVCDVDSKKCRCDEDNGYIPFSIVTPNVNVTVKRKGRGFDSSTGSEKEFYQYESIIMRVDLNPSTAKRKVPLKDRTPFQTETRCVPRISVSRIVTCGETCSLDVDAASELNKLWVCDRGLVCHYCPTAERAMCVKVSKKQSTLLSKNQQPENEYHLSVAKESDVELDFCEPFFSISPNRPLFMWLSTTVVALMVMIAFGSLTFFIFRKVRRYRTARQLALEVEETKSVSLALIDATSSQVPQVWATFRITPWRYQ